jgi:hypothetical protein
MNKFNSLPKGTKNIYSGFGLGSVGINGLTIYTFRMRIRKDSPMHMAYNYVRTKEAEIPVLYQHQTQDKKGRHYIILTYATTNLKEFNEVRKVWDTAGGYVLQYEADKKLGTKNAPPFIVAPTNSVAPDWLILDEELPF